MIFSKTWSYAVRALIHLAKHRDHGPVLSSIIAEREQIPAPFLAKILGSLAAAGIVASTRGPKGGFALKMPPEEITLFEVTNVVGTKDSYKECLLGFEVCPEDEVCSIHQRWKEPHGEIMRFLKKTTLAQISIVRSSKLIESESLVECEELFT